MSTRQHYSRPPITEAIIEIRVKPAPGMNVALLEKLGDEVRQQYPTMSKLKLAEGQVQVVEQVSSTFSEPRQVGFLFFSADGKQVFQPRLDGFAFARLAPYETWQRFRDEARRLWNFYRPLTQPVAVERVALRYINRLDLPEPSELKDYFRTFPEVSPDLNQRLDGFVMQLNIPQADLQGRLLLTETVVESPGPGVASVILDIDLFRDAEVSQDEEGLWGFLEELCSRKNQIFEGCITERVREIIR